jgi:hypothetical protein
MGSAYQAINSGCSSRVPFCPMQVLMWLAYIGQLNLSTYCWISHTWGNDRDAGQLQVVFSQVYNLPVLDLNCDNALNAYQVNHLDPSRFPLCAPACSVYQHHLDRALALRLRDKQSANSSRSSAPAAGVEMKVRLFLLLMGLSLALDSEYASQASLR